MTTPNELLHDRLMRWREKLDIVDNALAAEMRVRTRASWHGYRAFLYREQVVCRSVISELERLSRELERP